MKSTKSLFASILFGATLLLADPAMACDAETYCTGNCNSSDPNQVQCCKDVCCAGGVWNNLECQNVCPSACL
uniref:Uncharacterized protein n=1 Tax=Candidatus Kentrum sp. FW TaxID=2126338 RepID=A0A450RZV1_9GAMM|nr:MAG: hypothetical protein BECKFW1821A_GA0114235_100832 [Candidatus Kentron sp. FW]VFJ50574.1 MAG: hypothetical protein BECKFW1821B_GA0114236_100726 [Candidatus Kentron sp. FW]